MTADSIQAGGAEIYLIRHAESDWNFNYAHLIGGRSNHTPLTPTGEEQARALGRVLAAEEIMPTYVHASPAVRTLRTMELSLAEMGLNIDWVTHDDIQEMGHGEYEGRLREEVFTVEMKAQREVEGLDFRLPTGESMRSVGERMDTWVTAHVDPHEAGARHFVYTHGMAIRCLVGRWLGWSNLDIYRNEAPNVSLTKLEAGTAGWNVAYFARNITE